VRPLPFSSIKITMGVVVKKPAVVDAPNGNKKAPKLHSQGAFFMSSLKGRKSECARPDLHFSRLVPGSGFRICIME